MKPKGKLTIIEVGDGITDTVINENGLDFVESEHLFNAKNTIIPDAYLYADSRSSNSKHNKLFAYQVFKAINEGMNIILIAPNKKMLDKRLRNEATIQAL